MEFTEKSLMLTDKEIERLENGKYNFTIYGKTDGEYKEVIFTEELSYNMAYSIMGR